MSEKKNKITSELKKSATLDTPTRCCDARCKVCNSEHLETIHNLKKAGHPFWRIVEIAHSDLKFEISKSSLSRHFAGYQKQCDLLSAKIINEDLIEDATKQAIHTKKLVSLIDSAFKILENRIQSNSLRFDIGDLEKLMKLRYQVMSGEDASEKDILAIFQKATDKYGLNMQQGVLFKS